MGRKKSVHQNHGLVLEPLKADCKPPDLYTVFLLNDDYTPMNFVVEVLMRFFFMDSSLATQIMLQVHEKGKGICGLFTRDIAETKVVQVNEYAKRNQHPLHCHMEEN